VAAAWLLVQSELKNRRREEEWGGRSSSESGHRQETVAPPHCGLEEQDSADAHERDGEHEHRSQRPAWRAVRVPAADAVSPVAVFATDVRGEQDGRQERKGSEGHRAA
jgi:hypothetical protein